MMTEEEYRGLLGETYKLQCMMTDYVAACEKALTGMSQAEREVPGVELSLMKRLKAARTLRDVLDADAKLFIEG